MIGIYDTIAVFCLYIIFSKGTSMEIIVGIIAVLFLAESHYKLQKTLSSHGEYCTIYQLLAKQFKISKSNTA